jgi:hypothetical protein
MEETTTSNAKELARWATPALYLSRDLDVVAEVLAETACMQ